MFLYLARNSIQWLLVGVSVMEKRRGGDRDNFVCANKIERFNAALEKWINKERREPMQDT